MPVDYNFQISPGFPIAVGDEIKSEYFEDIRMLLWLHFHLAAGVNFRDYVNDCYTAATWAAYIDSIWNPTDGAQISDPGYTSIMYKGANQLEGDLYSLRQPVSSKTIMYTTYPCDANGVLNSTYWARVPDSNFYHDWDHNSLRRWVVRSTEGSGPTQIEHILDAEAYRMLPRQLDPRFQQKRIQYTDSERKICHRKMIEWLSSFVTKPSTLGAQYDTEMYNPPAGGWRETKFNEGKELGLTGRQYAHSEGEYGSNFGDAGENQFWYESKICSSYQNMIERVCDWGEWVWPIDSDEGAVFIANFNADSLERYVNETIAAWAAGSYGSGEYVEYEGRYFYSIFATSQEPVISADSDIWYTTGWQLLTPLYGDSLSDPTAAPINHRYWGCNESGFEFCLMVIGRFDWYWDSSHIHKQSDVFKKEAEDSVLDAYPDAVGTWRRTWRESFGVVATNMRPYEMGTPETERYSDFQSDATITPDYTWWSGIYRNTVPGLTLTSAQQKYIDDRHHPKELSAGMINDLWDVLQCLIYHAGVDASVVMQQNQATASYSTPNASLPALYAARFAAAAAAFSDVNWVNNTTPHMQYEDWVNWNNTFGYWEPGGGNISNHYAGVLLSGGLNSGRYNASEIRIRMATKSLCIDLTTNPKTLQHYPEFEIGITDGLSQTFQSIPSANEDDLPYEIKDMFFESDTYDGTDQHRMILDYLDSPPLPADYTPSSSGYISMVKAEAKFWLVSPTIGYNVVFKLDFNLVDPAVFSTVRDWSYTAIAEDDELFDADGLII